MTTGFRLTLLCLVMLCLLLCLPQPAEFDHLYRLSARDHGSPHTQNLQPTRPPFRLPEACKIRRALDRGNLWSSAVH
jgi:hypothetical protein